LKKLPHHNCATVPELLHDRVLAGSCFAAIEYIVNDKRRCLHEVDRCSDVENALLSPPGVAIACEKEEAVV